MCSCKILDEPPSPGLVGTSGSLEVALSLLESGEELDVSHAKWQVLITAIQHHTISESTTRNRNWGLLRPSPSGLGRGMDRFGYLSAQTSVLAFLTLA
jgi:hypothetical protein